METVYIKYDDTYINDGWEPIFSEEEMIENEDI